MCRSRPKRTDGMLSRKKRKDRANAAKPIGAYNLRFDKMSIYRAFGGWSCLWREANRALRRGEGACYFNAFPWEETILAKLLSTAHECAERVPPALWQGSVRRSLPRETRGSAPTRVLKCCKTQPASALPPSSGRFFVRSEDRRKPESRP